jgi:hypothetical protein
MIKAFRSKHDAALYKIMLWSASYENAKDCGEIEECEQALQEMAFIVLSTRNDFTVSEEIEMMDSKITTLKPRGA